MSDRNPGTTATSRRQFIQGAAVTAAAAATPQAATAAVSSAARPVHYGMLIDLRRCTGCHACSVSCKAENDVPIGVARTWVEYIEKGEFPDVRRSFLPRLCNHCSEPDCVRVCPTNATRKREEDGIVTVDPDICIGCKYCVQACPYDARFINEETGAADKCDFCLHRVEQGLVPACVNTCVGGARIFGDLNDPDSTISKMIASNPVTVLRPEAGTRPNVFYIGADHTDPAIAGANDGYVRVETFRRQAERR